MNGCLAAAPSLLLQKFPASAFIVQTALEFFPEQDGEMAGLVVMGAAYAALAVRRAGQNNQLVYTVDGVDQFTQALPGNAIRLQVLIKQGGVCSFRYALADGNFIEAGAGFQAREGRWIGAKVGIFSITPHSQVLAGHTDFGYFRFSAL